MNTEQLKKLVNRKIKNKKGQLTKHGFRQGFIEESEKNGVYTKMYWENARFQIKVYKLGKRVRWDSYSNLFVARRAFKRVTS